MVGLPATEFTIGLRPVNVSAGCDAAALSAERIRLQVDTRTGAMVISEEAPLSAWISSSDLLYRRGVELQKQVGDGVVRLIRTGVRSSGGWGTYFIADPAETYTAKFEVVGPIGSSGCESRLVVLGGGWK